MRLTVASGKVCQKIAFYLFELLLVGLSPNFGYGRFVDAFMNASKLTISQRPSLDGSSHIPDEVELPLSLRFRATQEDGAVHAESGTYCSRKRRQDSANVVKRAKVRLSASQSNNSCKDNARLCVLR